MVSADRHGDRLPDIVRILKRARVSLHDLSYVKRDRVHRRWLVPRFNMPLELGLALGIAEGNGGDHDVKIFEAERYRLQASASDLSGRDPGIHYRTPEGVVTAVLNEVRRLPGNPHPGLVRRVVAELLADYARRTRRAYGWVFDTISFEQVKYKAAAILADLSRESGGLR
jgi:hypothetical protein